MGLKQSWVWHLLYRLGGLLNPGQGMLLTPQSLEVSWGFLESVLADYYQRLQNLEHEGIQNIVTTSRFHTEWMITRSRAVSWGSLHMVLCPPPAREDFQSLWGVFLRIFRVVETQLSVIWKVGLHVCVTADGCHGSHRIASSVFVGKRLFHCPR